MQHLHVFLSGVILTISRAKRDYTTYFLNFDMAQRNEKYFITLERSFPMNFQVEMVLNVPCVTTQHMKYPSFYYHVQ